MRHSLASNNKDPRLLTNNNKDVQKMAAKQLPSYYSATKMLNISDLLILGPSTVDVHSCKSKRTTRNKDSPTMTANATTKKQNDSDPFILLTLTESVYSRNSEHANTENNNHKQNLSPTCIRTIRHRHLQKNRKIITKSDSDESGRDERSNAINKDTKKK